MDASAVVKHHNSVLRRSTRRAWELEARLAAILQPILVEAGEHAATVFEEHAVDFLTAAAAEDRLEAPESRSEPIAGSVPGLTSLSTMIAVSPRTAEAEALEHAGWDGATPAEELHVTLAYLGEYDGDLEQLAALLRPLAGEHAPMAGEVAGIGAFKSRPDNPRPNIMLPSVPGLVELRVDVTRALTTNGVEYSRDYGYVPHMTAGYSDDDSMFPSLHVLGQEVHFDNLEIWRANDERILIPFTGTAPMTSSASLITCARCERRLNDNEDYDLVQVEGHDYLEPVCFDCYPPIAVVSSAQWSKPPANKLVDVDQLVSKLRTKTDPVRQAVVETTMKSALDKHGIAFDVTNPGTEKVLAQAGSQIVDIAETTQLNVTRIIKASYDQGLTIPDTATAIREGMKEASVARSTLIARTELVGAVNGGSLAATDIVSDATGIAMNKQWLTAQGAHNPRHEMYDGLNGQTQPLDGYFAVGADQLSFPGDPAGSPEEVCNCRCTIVYTESGQVVAQGEAEEELSPEDAAAAAEEDAADEAGGADESGSAMFGIPEPYEPTGEEVSALKSYTNNSYESINESLRTDAPLDKFGQEMVDRIDHVFDKTAAYQPGQRSILYRSIHKDAPAIFNTSDPSTLVGRTFTDKAFMSASFDDDALETTTKDAAVIKIHVGAGAKVLDLNQLGASYIREEEEALLPRDTQLKITSATRDEFGVWNIEADVVVPEEERAAASRALRTPDIVPHDVASISEDRPYAHWSKATVDRQIVKSRSIVRKALEKTQSGETLTPREAKLAETHKAKLEVLLRERDIRKGIVPGLPTKAEETAVAMTTNTRLDALKAWYSQNKTVLDDRGRLALKTQEERNEWFAGIQRAGQSLFSEVEERLERSAGSTFVGPRREAIRTVLSEIRDMGTSGMDPKTLKLSARQAKLEKASTVHTTVMRAAEWYPRAWLDSASSDGIGVNFKMSDRGYFSPADELVGDKNHTIAISMGSRSKIVGDPKGYSTAIHELAHYMEERLPAIRAAESNFFRSRVMVNDYETEPLVRYRGGDRNEMLYRDEFVNEYMGKNYDPSVNANDAGATNVALLPGAGDSFELLSMGMEGIFTGSNEIWEGDPDMRNFILGLLVSL